MKIRFSGRHRHGRTCRRTCESVNVQVFPRSLAKCARTYENTFHISARIVPTTRKNGGSVVKKQIGVDSKLSYICAGSGTQPRNVHMRLHTLTPASVCIRNQFFRSYTCALVRLLVRRTFVTASVRHSYPQSSPRLFGSKHPCLQFIIFSEKTGPMPATKI